MLRNLQNYSQIVTPDRQAQTKGDQQRRSQTPRRSTETGGIAIWTPISE